MALNVAMAYYVVLNNVNKRLPLPGASQFCTRLRDGLKRSLKRLVCKDLALVAPPSGNTENADHGETLQPLSWDKVESPEPSDYNQDKELS